MLPELAKHSEKLSYFYQVALEGSLQATARKIGTTAPSLSYSIKQLEEVIGKPLFHRSKAGVTLTEAGEQLLLFCRKYYREMAETQWLMEHSDHKVVRKVKIGTFQSIALYFWPRLLESLREDSSISLSITTNRSRAITESLLRREIDIALTVETTEHAKLIKHELYKDDYSFYAPRSWQKTKLSRKDLLQHALLYIPDAIDKDGKSLRQHIQVWNLKFRDEFELDSLEVISEFAKKGYGIAVLPSRVAKRFHNSLRSVQIEGVGSPKFGVHRFFLSYRSDLDLPQKVVTRILESARKASMEIKS